MIKEKFCNVKINAHNKHFYKNVKIGDIISIKPENTHHKFKITAICEICGNENYMTLGNYWRNFFRHGKNKYTCKSCMHKTFGSEHFTKNRDQVKIKNSRENTWLKKYGVKHNSQVKEIKEKMVHNREEIMLQKYGTKYALQVPEFYEKALQNKNYSLYKIKPYNEKLNYQASYEKHFLDYCTNINIIHLVSKGPTIRYFYDNMNRRHYPDFYIKELNLIIEIKSSYTYKQCEKMNNAKRKASINQGYNYIFIIDKDYTDFNTYIDSF